MPSAHSYRPDIDGLRAVAILPVVWLHSGLPGLPGGFTGVDIFYVISGFLITQIIHRDVSAGRFSLVHFYERRVRRIAPAFLLMMGVSTAAALVLLLADELEAFARTAVAALAMASNIYFSHARNYFAPANELAPLVHTWSLGVEEQFYLLFPATLLIAERLRITRAAIAFLGLASLAACLALTGLGQPAAAFYLLPTRGWQLVAGSALALGVVAVPSRLATPASILGGSLILASCLLISGDQSYPDWRALCPVAGAVLLIGGGPLTWVGRILSMAIPVAIGRISYSLYLWHWPVFVFLRHWRADPRLSPATALAGVALSFILSALTYCWIEQPARRRATPFRTVLIACIAATVAIALALGAAIVCRGLPQRIPAAVTAIEARHDAYSPLARDCTDLTFGEALARCRIGPPGNPHFVIWGDSHAAAVAEGVQLGLSAPGLIMSRHSCAPSVGELLSLDTGKQARECRDFDTRVVRLIESNRSVSSVVLSAYWPFWSSHWPGGERAFWHAIQQAVDRVTAGGKRVVVIAGIPQPGVDAPWAAAIRARFGRPALRLGCSPAKIPLKKATIIDVSSGFCGRPSDLMFVDDNHISQLAGMTIIAPEVAAALSAPGAGKKQSRRLP